MSSDVYVWGYQCHLHKTARVERDLRCVCSPFLSPILTSSTISPWETQRPAGKAPSTSLKDLRMLFPSVLWVNPFTYLILLLRQTI